MAKQSIWSDIRDIMKAVMQAYDEQRHPMNDADLDNEQPITLQVRLTLGNIRRGRNFLRR